MRHSKLAGLGALVACVGCASAGDHEQLGSSTQAVVEACTAPNWDPNVLYEEVGTLVTYQHRTYRNLWWHEGVAPGTPSGPWELVGDCSGEPVLEPCTATAYDPNRVYDQQDMSVTYRGYTYVNKWWTRGETPGPNTAWKWMGACSGDAPPALSQCSGAVWSAGVVYEDAGTVVTHDGAVYRSQWWAAAGQEPGNDPSGVWRFVEECAGSPKLPVCTAPEWNPSQLYDRAGIQVTHDSHVWSSKWYTQGQEPAANTAWKWVGDCERPFDNARIARTATAPVIDGSIDTAWDAAYQYELRQIVAGSRYGVTDVRSTWQALWDADNLYVLTEVSDDALVKDSANAVDDDSIEVYIDANASHGQSYDHVNDFQYIFRMNDTAVRVGPESVTRTTGVQYQTKPSAAGYVIEAKIPWSTLGVTPAAGARIGIDVHVNDDDDGGTRDTKLSWAAPQDTASQNPSLFGLATLQAPPESPLARTWNVLAVIYTSSDGTSQGGWQGGLDAEKVRRINALFDDYSFLIRDWSGFSGRARVTVEVEPTTITTPPLPPEDAPNLAQHLQGKSYDSVITFFDSAGMPYGGWGLGYLSPLEFAGHRFTFAGIQYGEDWWYNDSLHPGEVIVHEWLHGSCGHYRDLGYAVPDPHGAGDRGYTDVVEGWAPWYRDLMQGRIWYQGENEGISPAVWHAGAVNSLVSVLPAQPLSPQFDATIAASGAAAPVTFRWAAPGGTSATVEVCRGTTCTNSGVLGDTGNELLVNPSFVTGTEAWWSEAWLGDQAVFATDANGQDASPSVSIEVNPAVHQPNDARWVQYVGGLEVGATYTVTGWIRGENVVRVDGDMGANLSLMGGYTRSSGLEGTFGWTQQQFQFVAESPDAWVACRLGFYGSLTTGKIWCDDISLRRKIDSWTTNVGPGSASWRVITQKNGQSAGFAERVPLLIVQ